MYSGEHAYILYLFMPDNCYGYPYRNSRTIPFLV